MQQLIQDRDSLSQPAGLAVRASQKVLALGLVLVQTAAHLQPDCTVVYTV
jgi:hypothetical protein